MKEDIKIKTDNLNFKLRVSGLIIKNNKILLVDADDSGFLCLPGGYVELGETTKEAIEREAFEELQKKTIVKKYLGVAENYFINKYSKKIHEIDFYYLLDFVDEVVTEDFILIEKEVYSNIKLDFKWININDIEKYDVRPVFLIKILKENKLNFNHIILNEFN